VEAFYDLHHPVSRGFLTFFQWGRGTVSSASEMLISPASSRCDGTAYDPFSHLAKSISAQRFEQNGRNGVTVSSLQMGQLISTPRPKECAHVFVATRSAPKGSSQLVLFLRNPP